MKWESSASRRCFTFNSSAARTLQPSSALLFTTASIQHSPCWQLTDRLRLMHSAPHTSQCCTWLTHAYCGMRCVVCVCVCTRTHSGPQLWSCNPGCHHYSAPCRGSVGLRVSREDKKGGTGDFEQKWPNGLITIWSFLHNPEALTHCASLPWFYAF